MSRIDEALARARKADFTATPPVPPASNGDPQFAAEAVSDSVGNTATIEPDELQADSIIDNGTDLRGKAGGEHGQLDVNRAVSPSRGTAAPRAGGERNACRDGDERHCR
jgi:hypothetical protein